MTPEQKAILKAAKSGDLEAVKTLIGQDPSLLNATDSDGSTPLHYAAWKGHAPLVAWLLDAGAQVDAENQNAHWGTTALCAAAHADHKPVVEILIAHGADVNFRNSLNNLTPLGHTKAHDAKRAARLLQEKGGQE